MDSELHANLVEKIQAELAAAEERGRRWQEKEMETLRGAVTLANEEIRRLVAAAHDSEERGRRRGEAERDELRDRMHQTIAFLLSCVASGEQLSNEEEVGIRAMLREALAPRDSAPACDAVLSSDPFREWRCGKPKGHEGPHSGEGPRDSAPAIPSVASQGCPECSKPQPGDLGMGSIEARQLRCPHGKYAPRDSGKEGT